MPTCFWTLVVSSPTCLWWKRGPVAIFLGKSHKEVGNSKGSQIHCAKKFSGSSKDCKIQSLLCDKDSGNSKGSKIHCAKNCSGSSKDCKIQPLL